MKNLTIGLFLAAAILSVAGQRRQQNPRGGHQTTHTQRSTTRTTHTTTRRTNRTTTRQSYRSPTYRAPSTASTNYARQHYGISSSSAYRGYGNHAPVINRTRSTSTFGLRRQPSRVYNQNVGGRTSASFRPTGVGHARSWFGGTGWHRGPAYREPIFECYPGFAFESMPSLYDTVWMYDPTTGEYYQAYYYPEYGYYAWASSPLVAVGVYTPSISFEIGG